MKCVVLALRFDGAQAICEYFWEQQSVCEELPSDKLLLIERFRDELGLLRIVLHASFGIRVHDPWAMALAQAIEQAYGFYPQTATVDQYYADVQAMGGARWDTSSLIARLKR